MIGIDEVGRGCWAGPLVVVAARQISDLSPQLKDSKLLSRLQRQHLLSDIEASCQLGIGEVSAAEIDAGGLAVAMRLGVQRALAAIQATQDETIIMDGLVNYCPEEFGKVTCVSRADNLYPIVSAASVFAKEHRDSHMVAMAEKYPHYGFERHVGYGTRFHQEALELYGISPIHRISFKPIQILAGS